MKKYGGWDYLDYRWIAGGKWLALSVPRVRSPSWCLLPTLPQRSAQCSLQSQSGVAAPWSPTLTKSSLQLYCVRGLWCTQHIQYTSLTRVRNFQSFPLPCIAARETPILDKLYMATISQRPSLLHTYIHASFRVSSPLHKVPPTL